MCANSADVAEGLFKAKRVLCIQPHYDDNDIFAGGTLALLHDQGAELIYLTVTDDLVGFLDQTRSDEQMTRQLRSEQREAGRIIGVDQHLWLGFPDAGPYEYFQLRTEILACLRLTRPDFVFTVDPWLPYEIHRDHILTGQAAAEAVFLVNFPRIKTRPEIDRGYQAHNIQGIAFYNTASPNQIVDITSTFTRKHQSIRAYQAQFTEADLEKQIHDCELEERKAGSAKMVSHAEALKIVRPSQLHCNTETWKSRL